MDVLKIFGQKKAKYLRQLSLGRGGKDLEKLTEAGSYRVQNYKCSFVHCSADTTICLYSPGPVPAGQLIGWEFIPTHS